MASTSDYYKAYDLRYRQVHNKGLQWFCDEPSAIVRELIDKLGMDKKTPMLEIGCGEGRDARPLLKAGYNLLATDVSPAAIDYCRNADPGHADSYQVLDAMCDEMPQRFGFIFAIAVLHMLVLDDDRRALLRFIQKHLRDNGKALILTMGDGEEQWQSDIGKAFDNQVRRHGQSGMEIEIAATSCRVVSLEHLRNEVENAGMMVKEAGHAVIEHDFPVSLYILAVKRSDLEEFT